MSEVSERISQSVSTLIRRFNSFVIRNKKRINSVNGKCLSASLRGNRSMCAPARGAIANHNKSCS